MSEWPKEYCVENAAGVGPDEVTEVIPADLGRELYEALEASADVDAGMHTRAAKDALARYEREVGS